MDASAIQKLQESQSIENANKEIPRELNAHLIALPEDFKLHNLEGYHAERFRFRGAFSTTSIDAFTDYAREIIKVQSPCFIDSKVMTARVIFNFADNGHCDDTGFVALEKTAAYQALLKINGARSTQKEIAEFIEDWRNCLVARSEPTIENPAGEIIPIVRAIGAIRKISIEAIAKSESEVRSFGATQASMESIDVKSADMPPAFLSFSCEPYSGLSVRTFDLRLSVITDRAPTLTLRIVREEQVSEDMAREFKGIIEQKVSDITPEIKTFIGKFSI